MRELELSKKNLVANFLNLENGRFDIPLLINLLIPWIKIKNAVLNSKQLKLSIERRNQEQPMTLAKLTLYCILNADLTAAKASLVKN